MIIDTIETLSCNAGWRNYNFLKITTDTGIIGWSEFDEAFGPPGLSKIIQEYAPRLIGQSVYDHESTCGKLAATIRPAPYGLSAEVVGAIENALLDAKAKALGIPCYQLLGGKHRNTVPVYWSHCTTWRVNHPSMYSPTVKNLDDVKKSGENARKRGHKAVKTNLFTHENGLFHQWMPGFGSPYEPGLNISLKTINSIKSYLEALKDGIGPDMELMVDLNFNARTEGYVKLIRELSGLDLSWIELDCHNPDALHYIRQQSDASIASLETLFGVRQFLPYFRQQSIDIAVIDAIWNGAWQSMKISNTAEAFDINIAPHNFYSHLSTMMNLHFAAAVPNLRIMEIDVDRLPWDGELFDNVPTITNGEILVPDSPGWGCQPIEEALRRHPPMKSRGYLGL